MKKPTRKSKKSTKVSPSQWPAQYLVLHRTNLDDVPLLLTPDRKTAYAYAKAGPSNRDIDAAHNVFGIDRCGECNIAVVSFRNGRPIRMEIVRDLSFAETVATASKS